jgi:hypothetical protein
MINNVIKHKNRNEQGGEAKINFILKKMQHHLQKRCCSQSIDIMLMISTLNFYLEKSLEVRMQG